jgi:hypothetical protein
MKRPLVTDLPPEPPPRRPPVTDPAEPVIQAMLSVVDNVGRLLEDAKMQAGGEIARRIAGELPRAIDRLVIQRYRFLVAVAVFAAVVACGAGGVAGYWLAESQAQARCADQPDGSRVCWRWERLPDKMLGKP